MLKKTIIVRFTLIILISFLTFSEAFARDSESPGPENAGRGKLNRIERMQECVNMESRNCWKKFSPSALNQADNNLRMKSLSCVSDNKTYNIVRVSLSALDNKLCIFEQSDVDPIACKDVAAYAVELDCSFLSDFGE